FERAVEVRKIVFDKTGTLTSGALALTEASRDSLAALDLSARWILRQMTARSSHPVASAVHESLAKSSDVSPSVHAAQPLDGGEVVAESLNGSEVVADALDTIEEVAGQGIAWRCGGSEYRFGRPSFAGGPGGEDQFSCFTRDGETLAVLAMEEEIPSGTDREIRALEQAGYSIHLLSGDRRARVTAAAARLALDGRNVQAELDPQAKARAVAALDHHDTLMVGDGLNDAPGFEAAHATATPAVDRSALSARADLYYVGEGIASIGLALAAARRLQRVV